MQQVERQERGRSPLATGEPSREGRRIRSPRRIDHDEFAVEDRGPGGHAHGHAGQLGECRGEVQPVGIHDPHDAVTRRVRRPDQGECPDAAPPRLEEVLVGIERFRQRPWLHRPQIRQVR